MTPQEEKTHFDTFGFLIKRQLFSAEEMARYSRWYDEGFDAACGSYKGSSFSQMYTPGIGLHPGFCDEYLDDTRILGTLENLMGPDYLMDGSNAVRFSADTPWHQDIIIPMELGRQEDFLAIKAVMYLDDLSSGPGSLQIIPTSHRRGVREALQLVLRIDHGQNPIWADGLIAAGLPPTEVPGAVATRTRPGDIIFFNEKCFHSSWSGNVGRRYLGMNFVDRPTEPWHAQWLAYYSGQAFEGPHPPRYPDELLATTKPHLRRLIDYMIELDARRRSPDDGGPQPASHSRQANCR